MPVLTEEMVQQTMVLQMQLQACGDRLLTVRHLMDPFAPSLIRITTFCLKRNVIYI